MHFLSRYNIKKVILEQICLSEKNKWLDTLSHLFKVKIRLQWHLLTQTPQLINQYHQKVNQHIALL